MAGKVITASLALWAAALSGCGTLMNLSPDPPGMTRAQDGPTQQIYGGVRHDALVGGSLLLEGARMPPMIPLGTYLLLVDLPLSLVGDTITLPWMVAATFERWRGAASEAPAAPADPPPPRGEGRQAGPAGRTAVGTRSGDVQPDE
jgi:uncharacterized protein YceK